MCTAITLKTRDFYFGRTLDHTCSYGETVTVTPRKVPLPFRHGKTLDEHYAIIGMAYVLEEYPLYYDAVNEKGNCRRRSCIGSLPTGRRPSCWSPWQTGCISMTTRWGY